MLGIISAIIAGKKGHSTFGWFVAIWGLIELIMLFAKAPYAVGPGGLFLVIALCMTNLNKPSFESRPSPSVNMTTASGVDPTTNRNPTINEKNDDSSIIEPLIRDDGSIVCPACNTSQKTESPRCIECNSEPSASQVSLKNSSELSETKADEQFCKKETEQTIMDTPKVRFCRKCGVQLMNGSDHCNQCGTIVFEVSQS